MIEEMKSYIDYVNNLSNNYLNIIESYDIVSYFIIINIGIIRFCKLYFVKSFS